MAPLLVPVLRRELKRLYIEPFFGGGAAFAALKPKRALLSDVNEDLIRALRTIRTDHNQVSRAVHRFSNTEECYYEVRRSRPRTKIGHAARFLYLNRTSWGGIQRFNQEGIFNVPFGNSGRVICRKANLLEFARLLRTARLECGDFEDRVTRAGPGDVVYADPPYTTIGENNGFLRYNEHLFSWSDQQRLARSARAAAHRGAFIVVSGLWHSQIRMLYQGWWAAKLKRKVCVSREVNARRQISEAVLFSRKPKISGVDSLIRL